MRLNPILFRFPGGRWIGWGMALAVILPMLWHQYRRELPYNGFDIHTESVPVTDILSGGPGRDDIPSLTNPNIIPAEQADYLDDSDPVIGVTVQGEARAYPLRILNWHEIINDRLAGKRIVVAYCPLCGTGVVFLATLGKEYYNFGVSGLLYRDNLLMYDRSSQSLWSQITGEAISGRHRGKKLKRLPMEHATWAGWRRQYPHTDVLSPLTGYGRNYDQDPYREYAGDPHAPSASADKRLLPKARVIGIEYNGETRAYPFSTLALSAPAGTVRDQLAGKSIEIRYNAIDRTATVRNAEGQILPMMLAYWFAWSNTHPQTGIYRAPAATGDKK